MVSMKKSAEGSWRRKYLSIPGYQENLHTGSDISAESERTRPYHRGFRWGGTVLRLEGTMCLSILALENANCSGDTVGTQNQHK